MALVEKGGITNIKSGKGEVILFKGNSFHVIKAST